MPTRSLARPLARLPAALVLCLLAGLPARAAGCDALTVRLIRGTGASLAGSEGGLVVFRAADAERMSLVCGQPPRLAFASRHRQPNRYYFVLVGLGAQTLTGVRAEDAETLALALHQATLLTGEAQQGRVGRAVLRCEAGDRLDGSYAGTLCRVAPAIGPARHPAAAPLRSRAGLPAVVPAG